MTGAPNDGLLAGVRVLDLTVWRPGPYATQLLAELGADVIKIEPPGGDPMRAYPELFARLSATKRSVVLDLKSDDGRRRALDLAADADVVIEGFRPGVAARLGVGPDDVAAVNPSAIYCSVSGMGQDGPLALAPGHDVDYQAWSGALAPDGGEPVVAKVPIADLAGGMAAALGVCAALVGRHRNGEGEHVDVAMADVLATWTGAATPRATGVDESARGVPGYGMFETADGRYVALGVLTENHFWKSLCDLTALEDCRDLDFMHRMRRVDELQSRLATSIKTRDRDDWVEAMLTADIPAAPVNDRAEMLANEHFRARGVVTSDPWLDPNTGYPVRFANRPAQRVTPPPTPGEHDATAAWRDRADPTT